MRLKTAAAIAVLAAVLLVPHAATAKTFAKKGRIYDGHGLHLNQFEELNFDFKISSNGKRITHFFTTFLTISCGGNTVFEPNTHDNLSTSIGRGGNFTFQIQTQDPNTGAASGTLAISGKFDRRQLSSGTAKFHGTGPGSGCNMSRRWKTTVRPLYDRFVGRTAAGTRASFYRSIEARPQVINFDFGNIRARCANGSHETKTTTSVYSARIRHRRFSITGFTTIGEAISMSGKFSSSRAARGTVSLTGRDDCGFSGIKWHVKRTAHRVTGPLNFPALSP
ncbi:MAG: hypothetical protein JOZ73_09315 [Solirubrobacterales bacterium]|nr:hypothetical protein [Solirubrobacterales bacterium]